MVTPVTVPPGNGVSDPLDLQRDRETSMTGGRWVWLETALPPALGKETRGSERFPRHSLKGERVYGCQQKRFP